MAQDIIQLLTDINKNAGTTVLMVTHEHDLVQQFHHRIITVDNGRIVSDTGRPRPTGTVSLGAMASEAGGEHR
jgi:cell division transport system ATP-binding protein